MRDFSLAIYSLLLREFLKNKYLILSFKDYLKRKPENEKILILRHDVDKKPLNALNKAEIEQKLGISSTYYFRIVPESFQESIIRKISALGHEIGYHYEDLSLMKGNYKNAMNLFIKHLAKFRDIYPIVTICMHGSPTTKWNNLNIWKFYDYKKFGIIGEPNIDLDFNKFFYLTDTGMAWNLDKYAVRDLTKGSFNIKINSTIDIITHLKNNSLPKNVMLNTHPQRWTDKDLEWFFEIVKQTIKNKIKWILKKKYRNQSNAY